MEKQTMSNDMLGPLVRASVGLSKARLNLALDLVNRLKGQKARDWEVHLKNVLRDGTPRRDEFEVQLINRSEYWSDASDYDDPLKAYDQAKDLIILGEGYRELVLSKAQPSWSTRRCISTCYELSGSGHETMIFSKVKDESVFPDESTLCWRVLKMVRDQPDGKEGVLAIDNYPTIFFLASCVVVVSWEEGRGKWKVSAWRRHITTWNKRTRVVFNG